MTNNKKVLVGLSGGVDSAVCALVLKEQGYDVIGATMAIWNKRHDSKVVNQTGHKNACLGPDEKKDIEAASKIASQIGIEYHVFDCIEQFDEVVLKYFKDEYLNGRTPNPCIFCNALIKFGALPYVAKTQGIEFDKFATGHYAKVVLEGDRYTLKKAKNPHKDQSYFLYRLKQEQLKDTILPLGDYTKEEVRQIALKAGLVVADKKDSQDFYDGDYNELLEIKELEGNIVDTNGNILGKHKGIWNYTIGQRRGLMISSSEPLYVISLNKEKNEVVVGNLDKTFNKALIAKNLNFMGISELNKKIDVKAKFRSTQTPALATVELIAPDTIRVEFLEYQKSIAIGQSVVLYGENDTVLLGGIIEGVE